MAGAVVAVALSKPLGQRALFGLEQWAARRITAIKTGSTAIASIAAARDLKAAVSPLEVDIRVGIGQPKPGLCHPDAGEIVRIHAQEQDSPLAAIGDIGPYVHLVEVRY